MEKLWKVHQDRNEENPEIDSYTLSLGENHGGWNTDSGYQGYGLPKELALWICEILNSSEKECPYRLSAFGYWFKKDE